MDVVSHWFMGSGATHGRTKFWVAGAMGVLPDLLVFIPNTFIVGERPEIDENLSSLFRGFSFLTFHIVALVFLQKVLSFLHVPSALLILLLISVLLLASLVI